MQPVAIKRNARLNLIPSTAVTSLLALLLVCGAARAQIRITLTNDFIEKYKHRATIDATYTVDKAHRHPNPPANDGDMHIAGRAPEIGLATVAEIMNAKSETAAVTRIHTVEGTGQPVRITGAWRLWCEHGGQSIQVQNAPLQPFTTTNPPHVFEIHPITRIDSMSLLPDLREIVGFEPKDAEQAFTDYERTRFKIIPNPANNTVTFDTVMAGYNYVEFKMQLLPGPQWPVSDGRMVFAAVYTVDGDLLVHKRRMVFVKDSQPEKVVKTKPPGTMLHVLGIPRIDLSLVSWRVRESQKPDSPIKDEVLGWNIPYEMIIVAVYAD